MPRINEVVSKKHEIEISVSSKVSREELIEIIDQVIGLTGCTACGMAGIDFRIKGDPLIRKVFPGANIREVLVSEVTAPVSEVVVR